MNVDGAIAGILLDLGFQAEIANAFFILARVPGLVAHIIEEKTTQSPMRIIDFTDHVYVGSPDRDPDRRSK